MHPNREKFQKGMGKRARCFIRIADVVKLVDTPDLGSGAERYAGSSPSIRTKGLVVNEAFFFKHKLIKNTIE